MIAPLLSCVDVAHLVTRLFRKGIRSIACSTLLSNLDAVYHAGQISRLITAADDVLMGCDRRGLVRHHGRITSRPSSHFIDTATQTMES